MRRNVGISFITIAIAFFLIPSVVFGQDKESKNSYEESLWAADP